MKAKDQANPNNGRDLLTRLWKGISHPLRVRVLEVVNEQPTSPVEFEREHGGALLSRIAYHFKELAKYGYIECMEEVPRRGSVEHVYRAVARASFDDAEWEKIPRSERPAITATMLQGLIGKVAGALAAGTFDARDDRHLSWIAMNLDEEGWNRLVGLLARTLAEAEEIRVEAEAGLEAAGEEGFPVTFGAIGFESPRLEPRKR